MGAAKPSPSPSPSPGHSPSPHLSPSPSPNLSPSPSPNPSPSPSPSPHQVSWTWPGAEGEPLTVKAYTWQPNVTLLLDGRVVGRAGGTDLARTTAS